MAKAAKDQEAGPGLNRPKIRRVKLEDMTPAPYNPRDDLEPGDPDYENIKTSINEYGLIDDIVWNERTGNIVGGHQRYKVLQSMGVKEVAVKVVDMPIGRERSLNIMLNKAVGRWNPKLLLENVEALKLDDDAGPFGWTEKELAPFRTRFAEEVEPDEPPPPPEEPVTVPGDLYALGKHRLLCGDATSLDDAQTLLGDDPVDMVFTDPPYNVDYGNAKIPGHKIRTITGDKQGPEEWREFCRALFTNLKARCGGDMYVWGASGPEGMQMRLWLVEMGCHWSATIIWNKQQMVLSPAKYQRKYEPCFYGWFEKSSFVGDRTQVEVWDVDRPHNSKLHPTMKPVELVAKAVRNSSVPGNIVFDPFLGSGSTLIACEQLDRCCYGLELEPAYCDVIVKRWEDLTGQKAKLLPREEK